MRLAQLHLENTQWSAWDLFDEPYLYLAAYFNHHLSSPKSFCFCTLYKSLPFTSHMSLHKSGIASSQENTWKHRCTEICHLLLDWTVYLWYSTLLFIRFINLLGRPLNVMYERSPDLVWRFMFMGMLWGLAACVNLLNTAFVWHLSCEFTGPPALLTKLIKQQSFNLNWTLLCTWCQSCYMCVMCLERDTV